MMDSENSDPHANAYFNNQRIRRHLIKEGLINRQGDILPPTAPRGRRKQAKEKRSHTISKYIVEEERKRQAFIRNYFDFASKRARVQKIRGQTRRSVSHSSIQLLEHAKPGHGHTPSLVSIKSSSIRPKSACPPPIRVKNRLIRRPITAKVSNDDHCKVTMIYYGPPKNVALKNNWCQPNGDEIMVMQQHCGGENLPVFKGFVKPNQIFTFDSRRHRDYPFALALYINGLIDSRISVCCEYKHKHNVRLGSRYGLFGIYDVQKSQPCPVCRFAQQKRELLALGSSNESASPYRRAILTTEFPSGALLRTPTLLPESLEKCSESSGADTPSKQQVNRRSMVVQSSRASDETNEDERKSSRLSSRTPIKNAEPHHSSEPILSRRSPDDDKSSNRSTQTPIPLVDDTDDRQSTNSSSTISLVKNKNDNNHHRSNSSSSSFFADKEDIDDEKSSLRKKTNENLVKETVLSSTTVSAADDTFSLDKQLHLLEFNEDNQQQNDIIFENRAKSESLSSDEQFQSSSLAKLWRQIHAQESPRRSYPPPEHILVIWLDSNDDNSSQVTLNTKSQLRQIARPLRTFSDPQKCFQFFQETGNDKILLILSGPPKPTIVEQLHDYPQLAMIYIFSPQESEYEKLIDQYPKIKAIYTELSDLCEDLTVDLKQWNNDLNTFEISSTIANKQFQFLQNQLLKDYLLEIRYNHDLIHPFTAECRKFYHENEREIHLIEQFEGNYQSSQALHWYTKDCFVHEMVNRAMRTKDMKILFPMGFLVHDIHRQLEEIHSTEVYRSTFTVYRGQGVELADIEELKENQGGLLSFNSFISTSRRQNIAEEFARRSLSNGFPIAVLFRITIDPKITSIPFVSLEHLITNPWECETLLSFKAIFHIGSIEPRETNLWQIELILTDQILPAIQIESEKFNHFNDYEKLGELLLDMNELEKANDLYQMNRPDRSSPKYTYVYSQLAFIQTKLEAYDQAIVYYNLSLQTTSEETLNDYVTISSIQKEIGKILYIQKKIPEALEKFQYALNIQLEHLSPADLSLIDTYDLLAMVSEENNDYQTALEYYEEQLVIQEESSATKHSDLAAAHFKIAICMEKLNHLNEAMDHAQQSIDLVPTGHLEADDRQAFLDNIRERIE